MVTGRVRAGLKLGWRACEGNDFELVARQHPATSRRQLGSESALTPRRSGYRRTEVGRRRHGRQPRMRDDALDRPGSAAASLAVCVIIGLIQEHPAARHRHEVVATSKTLFQLVGVLSTDNDGETTRAARACRWRRADSTWAGNGGTAVAAEAGSKASASGVTGSIRSPGGAGAASPNRSFGAAHPVGGTVARAKEGDDTSLILRKPVTFTSFDGASKDV